MKELNQRPTPGFGPSSGDTGLERAMENFLSGTGSFDPIDAAMRRGLPRVMRAYGARPDDVEDRVEEAILKAFNTKDTKKKSRYCRFPVALLEGVRELDV